MSSIQQLLDNSINSINHLNLIPISLSSLLLIFILYKWHLKNPSKNKNLPPSPPKLPILGHLLKLGTHPHHSLRSLSQKYGDLMMIYLGKNPTLIISSSKMAKEIMKTNDALVSNRIQSTITNKLLYNCRDVATSPYGEYWRQMKTIYVLQLLSNKRVLSFKGIREEETLLLMEKVLKNDGLVVNLSDMLVVLTNDVICRVAFGGKYGENHEIGVDFKEVLKELEELLGVFDLGDFIPWLGWLNRFNGLNQRLDRCAKRFDLLLDGILSEHEYLDDQSNCNDENKTKDLIDVLLDVQKENPNVERDTIKALILDAFAAGTDTTYSVLEWTMAELLKHPNVMEEVQREIRGIAIDKDHITEDDLDEMKYLIAVIKESLRLHPPIPLLVPRESTEDIKINGYDIAARTRVIINAWAIHRDPEIWEEPEEFRPERFMNSSIDFKGHGFELVPFGGGRRICPGISFASIIIELVLANLMYKFNWTLPDGVQCDTLDMSETVGLTVHRTTPLRAIPTLHY
ncbi:unnamed protein product [Amaranthus hypochondriacus]